MNVNHCSRLYLAFAVFLIASIGTADELSWTGCGITQKAFMTELAAAYEAKAGTKLKLTGGGATKGIRSASAGNSDLGGTCRHWLKDVDGDLHPQERDAELVQVAWDALVVIVHPDNPVTDISLKNLKRVYDGELTNWSELGGDDRPIGLITREGTTSGVGHMFRQIVFSDPDYTFKARALKVKSTKPLEKKVEKVKTALAVDGISSAQKRRVKFLSLDGVTPSTENIASGKYPLYRPLYQVSAQTQKFIAFALSAEGQAIISRQGTVNLAEGDALKPVAGSVISAARP